jgi:hypothetical protein
MKFSILLRRMPAFALAAALLVVASCGNTGKLSGKVMFKGSPVPRAKIQFLCDNGKLLDATSDDNGNYTVRGVPIGRVRVGVKNFTEGMAEGMAQFMQDQANKGSGKEKGADIKQSMEGMMKNVGSKSGAGFMLLPKTVLDPEKSGIIIEVQGGSQEQDIIVPDL